MSSWPYACNHVHVTVHSVEGLKTKAKGKKYCKLVVEVMEEVMEMRNAGVELILAGNESRDTRCHVQGLAAPWIQL